MRRTLGLAVIGLALLPGFAFAGSPLRLECASDQSNPGRVLVCEYFMLGNLNAQLADLHDQVVQAGKAERIEVKRWVTARDACNDVDCLDRLFEVGIREATLALADTEIRQPAQILTNARGIPIHLAIETSTPATSRVFAESPMVAQSPAVAPVAQLQVVEQSAEQSFPEAPPARRPTRAGAYLALFLLAGVMVYVIEARRRLAA